MNKQTIMVPWYEIAIDPAKQPSTLREKDAERNFRTYLASYVEEGHRAAEPLTVTTSGLDQETIRHPASDYVPRGLENGGMVPVAAKIDDDGAVKGWSKRKWVEYRAYVDKYADTPVKYRAVAGYGRHEALPVLAYAYWTAHHTTLEIPCVVESYANELAEATALLGENEREGTVALTVRDRLAWACRLTKQPYSVTREVDFCAATRMRRNNAQRFFLAGLLNVQFDYESRLYLDDDDDRYIKPSVIAGVSDLLALLGKKKTPSDSVAEALDACEATYVVGDSVPRAVFETWTLNQSASGSKSAGALGKKDIESVRDAIPTETEHGATVRALLSAILAKNADGAKQTALELAGKSTATTATK